MVKREKWPIFIPRRMTTVLVAMVPGLNSLLKHFTRLQFGTRNTSFRASGPSDKSWRHLVYLPFFEKSASVLRYAP